jgi:hypothetical protein
MPKILTITRPSGLSQFGRKIHEPIDERYLHRTKNAINDIIGRLSEDESRALAILSAMQLTGSLAIVAAQLSRALEMSEVICSLENLVWPARFLTFAFEDKELPSAVVHFSEGKGVYFVLCFKNNQPEGDGYATWVSNESWETFVKSREVGADKLYSERSEAAWYMATLVIKIMAYASIPRHAPSLLTTKQERKSAGCHPKHIPGGNKVLFIRYLPTIIRENITSHAPNATGLTHRFLGRSGHIRYYSSDRYINMKGKWQWLPPIEPPEGVRIIYSIRQAPSNSIPVHTHPAAPAA